MIGSVTANWGTLRQQFLFLVCSSLFVQIAPLISWPPLAAAFAGDHRAPFLMNAAATVLLAIIWLITFRDKPQYHPLVNGLELNKIVAGKIKVYFLSHNLVFFFFIGKYHFQKVI
ncbi:unnamed protein product [Gongylonema pulchrum]|uniref:MFS domain-containing protein n=1 Tax=Gongylonema pulchrum TaxID=637853 RepID=A0A183ENJ2_9BILA|nr:unnamed protein product [Gongylonema pulchrum]